MLSNTNDTAGIRKGMDIKQEDGSPDTRTSTMIKQYKNRIKLTEENEKSITTSTSASAAVFSATNYSTNSATGKLSSSSVTPSPPT